MEDVRVVGLSRVSYEAPVLAVVAVGCGRLLSASPWTAEAFDEVGYRWGDGPFEAEAFGDPVDSYDWELSTAEGFDAPAVGFSWGGGPFEAEAFDPVDYVWKLSEAEAFGPAGGAWGGESSAESFGEPVQNPEWRWEP